jgi:hypothetical protein
VIEEIYSSSGGEKIVKPFVICDYKIEIKTQGGVKQDDEFPIDANLLKSLLG